MSETLNTFFADTVKILGIEENIHLTNPTEGLIDPIDITLHKFDSHPSILKIRKNIKSSSTFSFSPVTLQDVVKEINNLDAKKANTHNNIPVINLKENIDISGEKIHKIFNDILTNGEFPEKLKLADITPLFKNDDSTNKKNYRPISILPAISKVFEKLLQKPITTYIENYLHEYICGYRKWYSTQHALITLLEKWKIMLDKQGYAGAILMDLSKAFDTINHELLLAKLHAYGFDRKSLLIIGSYLKNR